MILLLPPDTTWTEALRTRHAALWSWDRPTAWRESSTAKILFIRCFFSTTIIAALQAV